MDKNEFPETGWYTHIKSGKKYYVSGTIRIEDADGLWQDMVLYSNETSEKDYARFPESFNNSFEPHNPFPIV